MHNFFHSFSAFGLVLLTIFSGGHHHTNVHTNSVPVVHEVRDEHIQVITAKGSISKFGQTVTITFTFPEQGGPINGTIAGSCTGTIQGIYSGKNLSGSASATCPVLLTSISGTGTFSGSFVEDETSTTLHATITAHGMSENIEVPVTFSQ